MKYLDQTRILLKRCIATLICLCIPTLSFAAEKLVFAIDLIRHGDRTPLAAFPNFTYQWPEGLGQLTAEGMRQEYALGVAFRNRYIDNTHLLPPHFQSDTIHVFASDYSRTLMSANALLMGLYPLGTGPQLEDHKTFALPNGYQPVPIHTTPSEHNYLLPNTEDHNTIALYEKLVFPTPAWQEKEKQLKTYFQHWNDVTGAKITRLDDLKLLADSLYIYRLHQIPLPKGLSEQDIKIIMETTTWVNQTEERSKEMLPFYRRDLSIAIADYLKTGSENKTPLKYVLLSAHDSTIIRALTLLGVTLPTWPPYASDLNFSLYESGKDHFLVKVSLNGAPITIPACGGTVCSLHQLISLAHGE